MAKLDFDPASGRQRESDKPRRRLKDNVPQLPALTIDPETLADPDQRAVACVNLRLEGTPYHEIAKLLNYPNPRAAEQACIAALSRMHPVDSWETLRQHNAMRVEQQLRRSIAMASADYLVVHDEDKDGNLVERRVPNTEKRQWHEQVGKDIALHAMITGAKAPARVEISADTQELGQMVNALLISNGGQQEIEASIWDAEIVEDEPEGEE